MINAGEKTSMKYSTYWILINSSNSKCDCYTIIKFKKIKRKIV